MLIFAKTGHKIWESLLKDNSSLFMSYLMIEILVFCIAILSENYSILKSISSLNFMNIFSFSYYRLQSFYIRFYKCSESPIPWVCREIIALISSNSFYSDLCNIISMHLHFPWLAVSIFYYSMDPITMPYFIFNLPLLKI